MMVFDSHSDLCTDILKKNGLGENNVLRQDI